MATHIVTARYTERAIAGLVARPENRESEVRKLIEAAGGKMLAYYMATGDFDFIIIIEGALKDALPALLVALAGGSVTDLKTVEAFTPAEFKSSLERAHALASSFKSAGA